MRAKAEEIRKNILQNGPQWNLRNLERHIAKRKQSNHIPQDWTMDDFNRKIVEVLASDNLEIYIREEDGERRFFFGVPKWLIVTAEEGTLITSFLVENSWQNYLDPAKGYIEL